MYKHFGVMLDVSRNAVMKVSEIKKFIDCLEKIGYNTLELYAEDTYLLEDEKFFGYMRGGYSNGELIELDAYAKEHGVELIPCIQTLAHFTNLVKIPKYSSIVDVDDILLVGEDGTYELIEKIFKNLTKCFTSRKVNIGMDEAHMVGLGKYLSKHGYQNRFDVLLKHLNKVSEIANKYGFTIHMWSDMFFRLCNDGQYAIKNAKIDMAVMDKVPDNVELVYWDYYNCDTEIYNSMLDAHLSSNKTIWFAGGAWCWNGFAPMNRFTLSSMKPAMQSVKEHKIENVLITLWGDNGKECSFFATLPSLYAIKKYAEGEKSEEKIKRGFFDTFGVKFDDFMLLDLPNSITYSDERCNADACKTILYSDCLVGRIEKDLESFKHVDYEMVAKSIKRRCKYAGEYEYIFDCMYRLCKVLAIKKDLGYKTRTAYKTKDIKKLTEVCNDYQKCYLRVNEFYKSFKFLWEKENKPFGWEIQDARLGGLKQRLLSIKSRISDFVSGKIDKIDELEIEPLLFLDKPSLQCNSYKHLISPSEI